MHDARGGAAHHTLRAGIVAIRSQDQIVRPQLLGRGQNRRNHGPGDTSRFDGGTPLHQVPLDPQEVLAGTGLESLGERGNPEVNQPESGPDDGALDRMKQHDPPTEAAGQLDR